MDRRRLFARLQTLTFRPAPAGRKQRRLRLERLEDRSLMAGLPLGAMPNDTAEYMLGRIAVTPVLLESNGAIDANALNWTASQKAEVLANLETGLEWWQDLLATKSDVHELEWVIDTTYVDNPVATSYEPINRVSNDYVRWVPEFLQAVGQTASSNLETNIRAFNHAQRVRLDTDWAFTVFVVNSAPDQLFASGGSFSRAFAFAGGLFFVTPSNRPASTYTHETGHMFWARDEYQGGGNYTQRRGYYNSQNLNAIDLNPDPNFVQIPSIMSAGAVLDQAYAAVTTADATLAQLGWQDSDGDGIFDVLDVPLALEGVGGYEPSTQEYRFVGSARAQALPNRNSSGLQNDITLNRIGRIEYRLPGTSTWTTIAAPDEPIAAIDVRIPIPTGTTGVLELRAIDPATGVSSAIFRSQALGYALTAASGASGMVWFDRSNDGQRQAAEGGLAGWTVQIVDAQNQPRVLQSSVEPDTQGIGTISSTAYAGITLRTIGLDADGTLAVDAHTGATTGTKVFVPYSPLQGIELAGWRDEDQQLEGRFTSSQASVTVDIFGVDANSIGRIEAYAADGRLLQRVETSSLAVGQKQTLRIDRSQADIDRIVIKGHMTGRVGIDNLRFGADNRAVTGTRGEYRLSGLLPGEYRLLVTPSSGYTATAPGTGLRTITVVAGAAADEANFGFFRDVSPWQNPSLNVDVNGDSQVFPLDVLLVINAINRHGVIDLQSSSVPMNPSVDVNGDRLLAPIDVLLVINYLTTQNQGGGGEGERRGMLGEGPAEGDGEPADAEDAADYLGEDFDPRAEEGIGTMIDADTLDALVSNHRRRTAGGGSGR